MRTLANIEYDVSLLFWFGDSESISIQNSEVKFMQTFTIMKHMRYVTLLYR